MNEETAKKIALGGYLVIGLAYLTLFYLTYKKASH